MLLMLLFVKWVKGIGSDGIRMSINFGIRVSPGLILHPTELIDCKANR